jgi:hypothetical protein
MKRILKAIWCGFDALWRLLWYPCRLPACCRETLGDHPDIESALRTGYPESCSEIEHDCPGCDSPMFDDYVRTDCGLKVCRDCIKLCEGCEAKVECEFALT